MTTTEEQHHLIQKRLTWGTKVFNFSTSSALNCITRSCTAFPGKTRLLNILAKILFNCFTITTFGVSSNMEKQNKMFVDAIMHRTNNTQQEKLLINKFMTNNELRHKLSTKLTEHAFEGV
jgi:hypothetical protein